MKVLETRQVEQEVVIDVVCDMCKKSCLVSMGGIKTPEYSWLTAEWGYESDHKDGLRWEAQFCDACSEKLKKWVESQGGEIKVVETI